MVGNTDRPSLNSRTPEELEEISWKWKAFVTIPAKVEIKTDQKVLNLEEAESILKKAYLIVLMDCACRTDMGNCDYPLHICLRLDERGEAALEGPRLSRLNPAKVTVEEALQALRDSHEAGLVHMALSVNGSDISEICSCCTCCCALFQGILRHGIAKHILSSSMISVTDKESCTGCGVCIDRCQFNARSVSEGGLVYDPQRCLGCGLCVTTCPTEAIRLVPK